MNASTTGKSSTIKTTLIILGLIAALTAMCGLYVFEKAKRYTPANATQTNQATTQQTIEWKLITSWPKNFPGLGVAPEEFAKLVNTMSNGRLHITVFAGGELVPALGVFDAVSNGTADAGHSAAYYWKGKSPAAPFFTSVPFGLTAQEMNGWLHQGGGMALWEKLYKPFNIKPLAAGNTGVQMAGWFNKEINSLADLKGLKMRIPGIGGEVFTRVGGTAVTIPGGEIYTSLQTGVIDATEWVGPYNDLSMGLHEVTKYYYYPGWHEPGPTLELSVNIDSFNALPNDLQTIVTVAARAVNQSMLDEYTAQNNAALQTLINEHNVKLRQLPKPVMSALKRASNEVLAELVAQDDYAKEVYESYKRYADSVKTYHRYSEQAYINGRDIP